MPGLSKRDCHGFYGGVSSLAAGFILVTDIVFAPKIEIFLAKGNGFL